MGFELKMALRYLLSSWRQSALLVSGVAVGVVVFTFMAALMNGLGVRLTDDITGNVAHVTLEPELRACRAPSWRPPRGALSSPSNRDTTCVRSSAPTGTLSRSLRGCAACASPYRRWLATPHSLAAQRRWPLPSRAWSRGARTRSLRLAATLFSVDSILDRGTGSSAPASPQTSALTLAIG